MGNCVKREFGIDEVKESPIDHEQMFKNIVSFFLILDENERNMEE